MCHNEEKIPTLIITADIYCSGCVHKNTAKQFAAMLKRAQLRMSGQWMVSQSELDFRAEKTLKMKCLSDLFI